MSDLNGLPLFTWRKVLPFPVSRQASKVRDMAEDLIGLDPETAERQTRIVVLGIRRRMSHQGFSERVIEREVANFMEAVRQEMVRISYRDRQAPDGAA